MPTLAPRLHLQRQRRAVALADASARAADRQARRVWAALWRAAADGAGWARYVELLQLLMPSMRAAVGLSWRRLAVWAYTSEARLLARQPRIQKRMFSSIVGKAAVRSAFVHPLFIKQFAEQWMNGPVLAVGQKRAFREAFRNDAERCGTLTEDAADDLLPFLFPAPTESDVSRVLAPLLDPARWAGGIGDRVRLSALDVAKQIAFGLSAGQTVGELKKLLTPYFEGSRTRAMRSARTFGLVAVQSMTREAHEQLGDLVVGYQVHATLDGATRPEHRARDGTTYWKEPGPGQKGLAEMPNPPREADGSIAWNCMLPGTVVQGRFVAGSKAEYAGKAVEVATASGLSVRVTPNHPILTAQGFVSAEGVQKGAYLVRYVGGVHGFPDGKHYAPTAVEYVFGALANLPGIIALRPGVFDFNGDEVRVNGDVEVVLTKGMLAANLKSQRNQRVSDRRFVRAARNEPLVTRGGAEFFPPERISVSSAATVGSLNLSPSPFRVCDPGPLGSLCFGSAANLNASLNEDSDKTKGFPDPVVHASPRNPEFVGQLFDRFPSQVALDEVIEVRHFDFSGHVFDLQGEGGWIVANGLFQHNCRCYLTPVLAS